MSTDKQIEGAAPPDQEGSSPNISGSIKKWAKDFKKDFVKREYAPLKILFFLIYGANFCLLPFLTLQARSLGITEEEVGIIYSFMPIAALIAPPIAGMIADHIGNFKIFVSAVTALAGLIALLLLTVPVGRVVHTLPPNISMELSCSPVGGQLIFHEEYPCDKVGSGELPVRLQRCFLNCSGDSLGEENLTCEDASSECSLSDIPGSSFAYSTDSLANETLYNYQRNLTVRPTFKQGGGILYRVEQFCSHSIQDGSPDSEADSCTVVCEGQGLTKDFCTKSQVIEEVNPNVAFYGHLAARLTMEFSLATSMPLLEGAAATVLKEHGGDFGFQRLYANLGMVSLTPISGILIDYSSRIRGFEDFAPAMYLYCGLKLFSAFIMLFLNLEFKQASSKVLKEFWSLLRNIQIVVFLISALISGICYGFLENFLFWLLQDLGADKKLMGMTITVGSLFGIPLLMVSCFIIKKLGHVNTLVLGYLIYILRFFGYTLISNPWLAMPFEALECITTSLMLVAFVSYAAIVATPSTVVTLQGVFGGLHFGVGRALGSLLGGYLIEHVGIITTFRIMGAIGGVTGVLYGLIYFFFFRKRDAVKANLQPKETSPINLKNSSLQADPEANRVPNGVTIANGVEEGLKPSKNDFGHVNKAFDESN